MSTHIQNRPTFHKLQDKVYGIRFSVSSVCTELAHLTRNDYVDPLDVYPLVQHSEVLLDEYMEITSIEIEEFTVRREHETDYSACARLICFDVHNPKYPFHEISYVYPSNNWNKKHKCNGYIMNKIAEEDQPQFRNLLMVLKELFILKPHNKKLSDLFRRIEVELHNKFNLFPQVVMNEKLEVLWVELTDKAL